MATQLTSPTNMNISWMMSVYATEYSPPSTVYARAITADMIIAIQVGKPIITASDDPVVWKSELIYYYECLSIVRHSSTNMIKLCVQVYDRMS